MGKGRGGEGGGWGKWGRALLLQGTTAAAKPNQPTQPTNPEHGTLTPQIYTCLFMPQRRSSASMHGEGE